jgi:hypothetical protein
MYIYKYNLKIYNYNLYFIYHAKPHIENWNLKSEHLKSNIINS